MPFQRDFYSAALAGDTAAPEWAALRASRPHVLITGTEEATEAAVAALMPHLQPPISCWTPDVSLPAPNVATTMLIRDVATLSDDQQRELSSWLEQSGPGCAQIVSTTSIPLFPLVEQGVFLDALYYRLNTLLLDTFAHRQN